MKKDNFLPAMVYLLIFAFLAILGCAKPNLQQGTFIQYWQPAVLIIGPISKPTRSTSPRRALSITMSGRNWGGR
jgi:hypothetical protein